MSDPFYEKGEWKEDALWIFFFIPIMWLALVTFGALVGSGLTAKLLPMFRPVAFMLTAFICNPIFFFAMGRFLGHSGRPHAARRALLMQAPSLLVAYAGFLYLLTAARRQSGTSTAAFVIMLALYFLPALAAFAGGEYGGWRYRQRRLRLEEKREKRRQKRRAPPE